MRKRINLSFFQITFFLKVVVLTLTILVYTPINQPVAAPDQEKISQQQKKVDRIRETILDHQEKLSSSSRKEQETIRELKKIDHQILVESRKYVNSGEQIQEQEDLVAKRQRRLDELKKKRQNLKTLVQRRLTAYYQMGEIGLINVVFSTSSLAELLNFREMYEHMLRHDRGLFTSFKNKIRNIKKIKKVLEKKHRKLEAAVSKARLQQNILDDKRQKRQDLLDRIKTKKALYRNALAEMKSASRELRMTLADLKGWSAPEDRSGQDDEGPIPDTKKTPPPSKRGFVGRKGSLTPPVSGEVIDKFRKKSSKDGNFISSEGINIKAEPGDEIKAIYKGKVIYAGILPGYGKMIIIDHGNHYISLVSGIAKFIKEVGEQVEDGAIIATASFHSGLLQNGIHFEIRHETEPVNPLAWLDPSMLEVKQGRD